MLFLDPQVVLLLGILLVICYGKLEVLLSFFFADVCSICLKTWR